jgi:hypothetical protein
MFTQPMNVGHGGTFAHGEELAINWLGEAKRRETGGGTFRDVELPHQTRAVAWGALEFGVDSADCLMRQ